MVTRHFHANLLLVLIAVVEILTAHFQSYLILQNFKLLIQLKNLYFLLNSRYNNFVVILLVYLLDVLKLMGAPEDIVFLGPRVQWYQPATLKQLLDLRNEFPHTSEKGKPQHRIVVGNTEIGASLPMVSCSFEVYFVLQGVEMKFKNAFYDVLICPTSIPEMNIMEVTNDGLVVGGAVTLTELCKKLKELVNSIPGRSFCPFGFSM